MSLVETKCFWGPLTAHINVCKYFYTTGAASRLLSVTISCRARSSSSRGHAEPEPVPTLQTFDPSGDSSADVCKTHGSRTLTGVVLTPEQDLRRMGPYNPTTALPLKVTNNMLVLENVEMSQLRVDIWPDDNTPTESSSGPRRPSKPPVTNVCTWLECYGRMAALLCTIFPEKAT